MVATALGRWPERNEGTSRKEFADARSQGLTWPQCGPLAERKLTGEQIPRQPLAAPAVALGVAAFHAGVKGAGGNQEWLLTGTEIDMALPNTE